MISFVVRPHVVLPNRQMVEVYVDDQLVAGIYPGNPDTLGEDDRCVKIISKYLSHASLDASDEPPKLVAHFNQEIVNGR